MTPAADPRAEAGRIARMGAALVRDVRESRWPRFPAAAVTLPSQSAAALPAEAGSLEALAARVAACTACPLHRTRTQTVFGEGRSDADLMFVGEAPGFEEDRQGRPFVGAAGALLDRIIAAMGLARGDVYIANILKCRPPRNRDPQGAEVAACTPFLKEQIALVSPRIICALGKFAAQSLLRTETPISRLRGRFHTFGGIPVMPTFHPAYLLRNRRDRALTWEDVQKIMTELGLPIPKGAEK